MSRYFNTTGPCDPDQHYMVPAGSRLPELHRLVEERRFFVLHSARQSGKTTTVRHMAEQLRSEGVVALHVSLESSRQTPSLADAEPRWLWDIRNTASIYLAPQECPPSAGEVGGPPGTQLSQLIQQWAARVHPMPLVLFFDEVDNLEGEARISFLAQLRAGFDHRPRGFASSICLVGMRDPTVAVDQVQGRRASDRANPFNVKSHSLSLLAFTQTEMAELYQQHTADTGQAFTPEALALAYELTNGQPHLVGTLGYCLTREEPVPLDRPIGVNDVMRARECIMVERAAHLENLSDLTRERRKRRVGARGLDDLVSENAPPMDEDPTASVLIC